MEAHSANRYSTDTSTEARTNDNEQLSENTPLLINGIGHESVCDDSSVHEPTKTLFWSEVVTITKFALPVFVTGGLEYSILMVSVITIGHVSTTALAAITLGSMTAGVTAFSIIQGLVSALDTLLPPAWTSSQPQLVGLWTQRMTVVVLISMIPMFTLWMNAEPLLIALNQDPEVARLASIFLRWTLLGLPAYGINCISRRYFQSQGLFTVPTRIIVCVAPLNALLNYALVWGPAPIRLGFIGAPIATAVSMNFVSLLYVLYGIFFVPRTAWHPFSRRMFTSLSTVAKLGLSGVGQTASEWWAWEFVALAASQLGPIPLAAQSVILTSVSTAFQAPYALAITASVRIGNLLGERKPRQAGIAAWAVIFLTFCIAAFTSTMFLVFRHKWAYMFNDDPQVVSLVAAVMPLLSLFPVFDGLGGVTAGIMRAAGKQHIGALLNLSAYYVFGIPMGLYFAFWLNMGLHGLWLGLTLSIIYAASVGTWISLRTDWNKEAIRALQRLTDNGKMHLGEPDQEGGAEIVL